MSASITCPTCRMTSYHPSDVTTGYCGNCHDYTGAIGVLVNLNLGPMEPRYRDRQGHPITLARQIYLSNNDGYPVLAQDKLPDRVWISTVWDGLPTGPHRNDIFETLVFIDDVVITRQRYTSEEEALATHRTLKRSLELVGREFLLEVSDG
jgi:hypothetical protein